MFAIAFDLDINALSKNYGEPYNNSSLKFEYMAMRP